MVKCTNRIQNLNKMILEYKREEKKFKIIQEEITNQQKEIEDLRLLILSTNFLNSNKSSNSLKNNSLNQLDKNLINQNTSKLNQSTKHNSVNKNKLIKNDQIKEICKDKTIKIKKSTDQLNKSSQQTPNLNRITTKLIDSNTSSTNQLKSKGLQTITKNVLNQKDNKYLIDNKNELFTKSKTDNQLIDKSTSSIDLKNRLNKIKSTMNLNKLENQENPRVELGLNKISKSIKKTRPIKSNLKSSSTKLANSNRQLQRV